MHTQGNARCKSLKRIKNTVTLEKAGTGTFYHIERLRSGTGEQLAICIRLLMVRGIEHTLAEMQKYFYEATS